MRKRHLLFILFLQASAYLPGQVTFKKKYGSSGSDIPFYVEVLADNSFLVAGSTSGGSIGAMDAMLVKFAADGTVEWAKVYGSSSFDNFTQIYPCSDGNFIAVGETSGMGGGLDIYVVKVDPAGNMLWERTCGGAGTDAHKGICEVSDGYIVTGSTNSFGAGGHDIFVEKIDFNGNSIWSKAFGNNGDDTGGEPLPASNNEIWICGHLSSGGNNVEGVLLKISTNGTLISATQVNGAHADLLLHLTEGGAGLTGSGSTTSYTGGSQRQPFLLGFNASGSLVWAKRYLLSSGNYDMRAEACPDGGFIFTPNRLSGNENNAFLVKTDGSGNISWAKFYTITGNGVMYHARPTPDGGYVAVGRCTTTGQNIFVIKTDSNGNIAGCCPEDAPITAADISPPTPGVSPGNANGPGANAGAGQEQTLTLNETDACNGPSCCPTYAGTMLVQTLHACINQPATLTHNGNEALDGNDLLQFILFSDPADTLGSIIAVSNTPTFTFNPATMQTGVTYYVAAIAGNNVGGNVDFNDPCFDVSNNAAELIWHPLPEVELQTDNSDVCPGNCRTLTAVLTGAPPFSLTVSSPAGTTTVTFQNNTGTFQICTPPGTPPGSFMVQATALTDAYCTCP